jgi:hypothetical protein
MDIAIYMIVGVVGAAVIGVVAVLYVLKSGRIDQLGGQSIEDEYPDDRQCK